MPALNDQQLKALLDDDVPCGDLTTQTLGIGIMSAQLTFSARQSMTACATEEPVRLFELAGARARLVVCTGTLAAAGVGSEQPLSLHQRHTLCPKAATQLISPDLVLER